MAAGVVLDLSSSVAPSFPPAGADRDTCHFDIQVSLDSTDIDHVDDAILVFQFPSVAWILNKSSVFNVAVLTNAELDDGTETLEIDVAIGGSDGIADYLLITGNASTIYEDGGADESAQLVALGSPTWIDVGGLYLQLIVRLAPNSAADGSVYVGGWYTQNLVRSIVSSPNL